MKKYKWYLILLNLIILLIYFNFNVYKKEILLENGQLILLKLAPVDPRSLMQGDYMSLRYEISEKFDADKSPKRGFCVVKIGSHGIAKAVRFQNNIIPLNSGEHLIKYSASNSWSINIGAESFFFQEGQGEKFEKAAYGGLKVDNKGNSLLFGLYDENAKQIK